MLALCVCSRRVVPPMDPPHMAKAFPNCGQESHTLVHVLALIFKITVLTPTVSLPLLRNPKLSEEIALPPKGRAQHR